MELQVVAMTVGGWMARGVLGGGCVLSKAYKCLHFCYASLHAVVVFLIVAVIAVFVAVVIVFFFFFCFYCSCCF